jgi:general transcription factor 3C polypeptide 3 (transcription factor C subunit 4)
MRQTDFYGLDMEEWLVLVIKVGASLASASWNTPLIAQYCCVLMVKSEEDVAMDVLEHVVWSGLFNNPRAEVALRLAIVGRSACLAFLGGARSRALEIEGVLMQRHSLWDADTRVRQDHGQLQTAFADASIPGRAATPDAGRSGRRWTQSAQSMGDARAAKVHAA